MAQSKPAIFDEQLLRDLVGGLSLPGTPAALSVGIVGSATSAPQFPAHCLKACLNGDPTTATTQGCPFLIRALQNEAATDALQGGRCPKGFRAAVEQTLIGGLPAVLITLADDGAVEPSTAIGFDLLTQLDTATRLIRHVGGLVEENAGFAEEALQNYEQLNLLFDLIPRIAQVNDGRAIERLLLRRIARLLMIPGVCLVASDGARRWYESDGAAAGATGAGTDEGGVASIVHETRATRQVHVATVDDWQVLAGPLVRLDEQVDVVVAARQTDAEPFTSGDLMLLESVLAFGGQIISNAELQERLRDMSMQVARALVAAIDKKDHYTSGHSERVGLLTRITAEQLGIPGTEIQIMEWAGLLHDIGKIGIPEEILCKPGKLTPEEFDVIKKHPGMGYEILKPIASFELVVDGVLYHHEHPDGSGYPKGLTRDEIPMVARIIHVVDTFDALTSTRSYRQAFTMEKASEIIRAESGQRIDADVADAFFQAFDNYRCSEPEAFATAFLEHREAAHVES